MCKKICPRKNDAFICPHFHPRRARLALHSFLSVCYCSALSGSVRLMSANLLPFCPCHVLYFLVMMMIFMQGAACVDEASILSISLLYVAPQIKGTNLIPKQQVNVSKCRQTAVLIMAANTAFISVPQLADITTG